MIESLADRVDAAARLADHTRAARGAINLATVAAYRLAATMADGEAAHAGKVAALQAFVAMTEPAGRSFRAALIEAAMAAEVDTRAARGLPFLGRRLRGWMDVSANPPTMEGRMTGGTAGPVVSSTVVEACAEAAT